jgi:hypothetical protein
MPSVSVELLIAASALAGAAAKLTMALLAARRPWRERAARFGEVAGCLGDDVEGLRFIGDEQLRRAHLDKMASAAHDAIALAMRLHNLLPATHPARAAAFDGASSASALLSSLAGSANGRRPK